MSSKTNSRTPILAIFYTKQNQVASKFKALPKEGTDHLLEHHTLLV